jgi:hypothetical protein
MECKRNNYYDLLLTEETSAMFLNFGIKEIMKNQISFRLRRKELYNNVPTKKIEVDSSVSIGLISQKAEGLTKILKIHNPWLRDKKVG